MSDEKLNMKFTYEDIQRLRFIKAHMGITQNSEVIRFCMKLGEDYFSRWDEENKTKTQD